TGPVRIEREGQVRKVSVLANYFGRDLGGISAEIKKRVEPIQKGIPFGYFIELGGQYKDMIESFKTIAWVLLLSSLLSYMVMASLFENLLHPFVIMFTIPLSFIGVVLGFWIGGVNISLPALMGFVMLSGIAVNNGIVMIDFINRLRNEGMSKFEAIVKGASTRLRPVLITSLTTIFGVLPMIFTRSEGAEMRVPLGLTLGAGLLTATILTLFVVPTIYSLMTKEKMSD
ncbi:MAG: efflux RND transporter permease subunit, partial [Thermodesulfovibrionales bacterium]